MITAKTGWPADKTDVVEGAKPYWNYRDEILCQDGILLKGTRVIIPATMRPEMLRIIHSSHLGIDKCKRRALDVIYWPGMSAQNLIEDMVSSCTICSRYQRSNPKEPLLPHSPVHPPWEKVGADLCVLDWRMYLVLVDYYSNFIEVDHVKETTSNQVIKRCKSQFARHGIPDSVHR